MIRVGTAGWSLPTEWQDRFPEGDTHLHRYARVLGAVEINRTFKKLPRPSEHELQGGRAGPGDAGSGVGPRFASPVEDVSSRMDVGASYRPPAARDSACTGAPGPFRASPRRPDGKHP